MSTLEGWPYKKTLNLLRVRDRFRPGAFECRFRRLHPFGTFVVKARTMPVIGLGRNRRLTRGLWKPGRQQPDQQEGYQPRT